MTVSDILLKCDLGIYQVIIKPIEYAYPELSKYFKPMLESVADKKSLYGYALGYLSSNEAYMEVEIAAMHSGYLDDLERFSKCCNFYYSLTIPSEFLNNECFNLSNFIELSDGMALLQFTCEIPIELAESKYGINFKQLRDQFGQ